MTRSRSWIILKSEIALPVSRRSFFMILFFSVFNLCSAGIGRLLARKVAGKVAENSTRFTATEKQETGLMNKHLFTDNRKATLLRIVTLLALLLSPSTQAGVVLLYHHVDEDTPAITSIAPAQFVAHLEILEAEQFEILPLGQLVETSISNEKPTGSDWVPTLVYHSRPHRPGGASRPAVCHRLWPHRTRRRVETTPYSGPSGMGP